MGPKKLHKDLIELFCLANFGADKQIKKKSRGFLMGFAQCSLKHIEHCNWRQYDIEIYKCEILQMVQSVAFKKISPKSPKWW